MNILVFSTVLPSPVKPNLNDILLVSADKHAEYNKHVKYKFILLIPYSNFLLSRMSKKWEMYYQMRKNGYYKHNDHTISVVALPMLGTNLLLNLYLIKLGYLFNKSFLKRLVKQFNPDILHAHNVLIDTYIVNKLHKELKLPYVVTDRSIYKYYRSNNVVKWMKRASAIISVNYKYKKISETIVGKSKSYLIPHGIEDDFFKYNADFNNVVPKVVSVCGLWRLKNIDKVLYALNNINTEFEYYIYGDGPEYNRLTDELSKLKIKDQVKFEGRIRHEEVPGILQGCDVFVMPSYPENFGRVFVEAMAIGLPVIGARGAGIDGYIENGITGFTVSHEDIFELEQVLGSLLKDKNLRTSIGRNAKSLAIDFTWRHVVSKLDVVYLRSLENQTQVEK